jgi:glyoxylase-like metal-dependent hydrolase (beta-lactamase superfamily II)
MRDYPELAEARREAHPATRLRKLRRAAESVREALLAEGPVAGLATCPLVTFPYPTVYAFSGAARSPAPYIMMTNRMNVVQWLQDGQVRTLLFNPTDYARGQKAPFYWNLRQRYGSFLSDKVLSTRHGSVASHLEAQGLRPQDVDYIAFDHLHIQDVRGWLGAPGVPAFFPRAKLLVQRAEWEGARDLHPMQQAWYVHGGTDGVDEGRVVLLDGDARLGPGVSLVSTPGHTRGNMSLAVVTPDGLFVVSENGVATESYTPLSSGIGGLRTAAEHLGQEVILNGNTREDSLDQYSSMILEKTLAGPSKRDPSYVNFYPSSELTASFTAPGLGPTFSHGEFSCGTLRRPGARASQVA